MLNSIIEHVSQLDEKQLSKLMKKLQKKFPVPEKKTYAQGFDTPVYIRDELVNFLKEAYEGTEMKEKLTPLLELKVLSRSVLTHLMKDYIVKNRFVETIQDKSGKPKENVFYKTDDLMNKHFSSGLASLEEMDAKKTDEQMTDLKGNRKLRFNRNKFTYVRIQSIMSLYIVPQSENIVPATQETTDLIKNLLLSIAPVSTTSLPPCETTKLETPEHIRNMPSPPGSPKFSLPCITI